MHDVSFLGYPDRNFPLSNSVFRYVLIKRNIKEVPLVNLFQHDLNERRNCRVELKS